MQIGEVIGHAVATVKHPTLLGIRLLLVQLLGADGIPDGEPVLALDGLGAGPGTKVIVTTDALGVRELAKSKNSPARYSVQGLCDG